MGNPLNVPGYDPERRRAWRAFLQAHAAVLDVLSRELEADQELPLSWYDVLAHLADTTDRRLRMQDLAGRLVVSRSGLTRRVDRMEQEGLVQRVPCEDDRRGTWAVLTDTGHARFVRARESHVRGVVAHFASKLDDDEATALAEMLERIASPLEGPDPAC